MSLYSFVGLFASACCAAFGNVLLKIPVTGRERLLDLINVRPPAQANFAVGLGVGLIAQSAG